MGTTGLESTLHVGNIEQQVKRYVALIEDIGGSLTGLRGLRLFKALKRDAIGSGPYPKVTLSRPPTEL